MIKKVATISKFLLIFVIITAWIFSGWPRIWQNPAIPPEIKKVEAAPDTLTLRPNAAGTYQEWSIFGGAPSRWQATSDQSDVTGVQVTGSITLKEAENLADTTQTGAINSVTAYMRAKATADGKTDAFIAYRDSTTSLSTPKERTWTGESVAWGSQTEMVTAGSPVRFTRVAYSPIASRSTEKIVVTLSDDGFLDAYVWDGTSWIVTNNIGSTGIVANAYKCFDVAYEKTTGRALLVYSRGTTTNEIGYRIWTFGTGWGSEQLLDLPYTTGAVYWISLATAPGTRSGTGDDNEIAMIYLDANIDVHGYVWTGSAWSGMGATAVWDATAAIATEECIAVAYEQSSGRAMFVWGDSVATDNYNRIWDGTTLSGPTLGPDIAAQGGITNWITLKSNPLSTSNELMFLVVDAATTPDLNTAYWSGSAWTIATEHDAAVDTHATRCADFAWEPTGSKGLLVWGTAAGVINWKSYTAPNTWPSSGAPTMGANIHPWVQLRTNPRSISGDMKILGAALEGTVFDLCAIRWDGTTFTVIADTISSDTTVITYECFEMEFMNFGPPALEQAVILWRTYNTDYESSANTISRTAFTDYSQTRTTNPNTGSAWTWAEVNALEVGARASTLGSNEIIQVSEFWIVVDYTLSSVTLSLQTYDYLGNPTAGTVNFGDLDPETTPSVTIRDALGACAVETTVTANVTWTYTVQASDNLKDIGANIIPIGNLQWATDNYSVNPWVLFQTTTYTISSGNAPTPSTGTSYDYDYKLTIDWTIAPSTGYSTTITYTALSAI